MINKFKKNLIFFTITIFLLSTFLFSMPSLLYAYEAGNCTAYAKQMRPDIPNDLGDAKDWAINAATLDPEHGFPVDKIPMAGDIAVFQPGDHGAFPIGHKDKFGNPDDYGHVAYVESVNNNGTFNISEMNVKGKYVVSRRNNQPVLSRDRFIHKKTTVSQAVEQSATPTEKNFFGVIGDWFKNLWNNITDIFTVQAAETSSDKSATIAASQESQSEIQGSVTTETIVTIPAPSKPSLTSPYNWYQSLGGAPTLIWKGDENSISYYVIVNSSNTGDIKSGWIGSISWKPNLPNENYIYSWKVKAKNSQGVESEWSENRNFSVASTTLKFEGDISFSPPSPSSADRIKIFASTTGWGGVGVTLRVSVNTAPDGSSNGEWKILKELGVPKFNEVDAPEWHTNGWSNGTYRIRVEAKGPDDPQWRSPAVIETTYTLIDKPIESEQSYEETGINIDLGSLLENADFSFGNFDYWNTVGDVTIYNDGGNLVAKCVSKSTGGTGNDMYYHVYPPTNNLSFSVKIKPISFTSGGISVYAALLDEDGNLVGSAGLMYLPGDLPIGSWTTFSANLSSYPSFSWIIMGATGHGDNTVYFDDFKIY